jgi:hypothetical protein
MVEPMTPKFSHRVHAQTSAVSWLPKNCRAGPRSMPRSRAWSAVSHSTGEAHSVHWVRIIWARGPAGVCVLVAGACAARAGIESLFWRSWRDLWRLLFPMRRSVAGGSDSGVVRVL